MRSEAAPPSLLAHNPNHYASRRMMLLHWNKLAVVFLSVCFLFLFYFKGNKKITFERKGAGRTRESGHSLKH